MNETRGIRSGIVSFLIYLISIGLGVLTLLLWISNFFINIRANLPLVVLVAVALLIIIGISVGYSIYKRTLIEFSGTRNESRLGNCCNIYGINALIGCILTIIVALLILVTNPVFLIKAIQVFTGSTAFWLMIISFFAFIICEIRRISLARNSKTEI